MFPSILLRSKWLFSKKDKLVSSKESRFYRTLSWKNYVMVLITQILKRYLHKESFVVLVVSFVFTDTHVDIVVVKQCILLVLLILN